MKHEEAEPGKNMIPHDQRDRGTTLEVVESKNSSQKPESMIDKGFTQRLRDNTERKSYTQEKRKEA